MLATIRPFSSLRVLLAVACFFATLITWTQLGETGNYTPKIPRLDSDYFRRKPPSFHPTCFTKCKDRGEGACSINQNT